MDLIDTHQHLIYRARIGYGWTADKPALARGDFTVADYQALTRGLGVAGTLVMEAGVDDADYRAEAQMVAGLMLVPGSGILGQIAACRPEAADMMQWLDASDGLGVVGYRRILHEIDDAVSQTAEFRRNVRSIGACGKSFDICVLGRQLPVARALALACPDTVFVLDHCGVPDVAGGDFTSWAKGLARIAELPHVMCKLSGILAYCAPGTASLGVIRPYVDHVLTCFGADRVLWGSDWPVLTALSDMETWFHLVRQVVTPLGEAALADVFGRTALRVYGIAQEASEWVKD